MAGPADLDDVYQTFDNGTLIGSFGNFPVTGRSSTLPSRPCSPSLTR